MWQKTKLYIIVLLTVFAIGCQSPVTISPEADMLITGYKAGKLSVSGCHDREIIDLGWVRCEDLQGRTITIFEEWNEVCK